MRAFCHTLTEIDAVAGIFITIDSVTDGMKQIAENMGKFSHNNWTYPKLQFWQINMETSPAEPFVRAVDVARKIGVRQWTNENWLTSDILKKLEAAARVEQREAGGPWKLTEAEYQKRC